MDGASDILFATVLRPNPPLAPHVLKAILILVAGFNAAFAIIFLAHGAWPVLPFLGLDVALLAWAFRASVTASKRQEHLTLTFSALCILRLPARAETVLNPYWLRVDERDRAGVALVSHGKAVRVGGFLGPAARADLAKTLRDVLMRVRQSR